MTLAIMLSLRYLLAKAYDAFDPRHVKQRPILSSKPQPGNVSCLSTAKPLLQLNELTVPLTEGWWRRCRSRSTQGKPGHVESGSGKSFQFWRH